MLMTYIQGGNKWNKNIAINLQICMKPMLLHVSKKCDLLCRSFLQPKKISQNSISVPARSYYQMVNQQVIFLLWNRSQDIIMTEQILVFIKNFLIDVTRIYLYFEYAVDQQYEITCTEPRALFTSIGRYVFVRYSVSQFVNPDFFCPRNSLVK